MGYAASDKLTVTGEAAKDIDQGGYRAGIEYHPTEVLYLRTGVTGPVQGHGGIRTPAEATVPWAPPRR
ncbi:MAG: hypothetical protein R2810_06370 [Flavobacteriales bacterium]